LRYSLKYRVCFERKGRGNRGGVWLGKVGKGRGYGQKCPFFYLPSLPIQAGAGRAALAGCAPGAAATGDRGKRRGGRGLFIPALTLAGDCSWGWLHSVGGGRRWWLGAVALGGLGGAVVRLGLVRGEVGTWRGPFIAREGRFGEEKSSRRPGGGPAGWAAAVGP
jgi:hypothetical protein